MTFTVLIGPSAGAFAQQYRIDLAALPDVTVCQEAGDGLHMVLGGEERIVRLRIEPGTGRWGGFIRQIEPHTSTRCVTTDWCADLLGHRATGPSPEGGRLSPQLRTKLDFYLHLIDGARSGASPRALAASFMGLAHGSLSAAEWTGASERKAIQRGLREADHLVAGGYLSLLRLPTRRRHQHGPLMQGD